MKFCEFLKFCNTYFFDNTSYDAFMYEFFATITSDDDASSSESSPFESDKFEAKAKKIYYGERTLPKNDARFVKSHFNENSFLVLIDEKLKKMPDYIRINLETELRTFYPEFEENNDVSSIICQLFLDYINEIINKKRAPRTPKTSEEKNNSPNKSSVKKNIEPDSAFDDQTLTLARNFCIDHEDEKELFPLCQIGNYIDPLHKHSREMYTEYNRLGRNVQKAIMFLNELPFFEFEECWEYNYLELFREDAKRLDLIKEKDLLYDGGKYFHRAKDYAEIILKVPNPLIFPSLPNRLLGNRKVDLIYYIDEYLYYRNDEKIKNQLTKEPPFEWMINNLSLLNCPEDELTYYMCLYIYSACHVIPREYGRKNPEEISFNTPKLNYIETMEDYYYAALLALYNIYRI